MKPRSSLLPAVGSLHFAALPATAQVPGASDQQRISGLIARMTLEEEIGSIGGTGFAMRPMPALGLPSFEMSDGPYGVRRNSRFPSRTYPLGIGLAASCDRKRAERMGAGMGADAHGVHFMPGPGVSIHHSPLNGRNFESFGDDPLKPWRVPIAILGGS